MSDHERIIRFNIGAAFPSADPAARYVMRLAMATGDLNLAADAFIKRGDELTDFERFYYVRLLASHLRETVMLIDPPTKSVVPSLDDFVSGFGSAYPDLQADLRQAQRDVCAYLDAPLVLRPQLTLRTELRRLRNQFFHYNWEARDDPQLQRAMTMAGEIDGLIREGPSSVRALYADEVANQLMHPFDGSDGDFEAALRELHRAIVEVLGKALRFARRAEALYLLTRPAGVVTFERGSQ